MKSGFPYLVDVKITEKCPFGCTFCYQSSVNSGSHASTLWLRGLCDILYKANVFEVNFGGGEPTLYSDGAYGSASHFSDILKYYKEKKFKIGVTTKNYKWHKSNQFDEECNYIDSMAISCNSSDDLDNSAELISTILDKQNFWDSLYIQCVFELVSYDEFKSFVLKIKSIFPLINLTLLGYKKYGFGNNTEKYDYPDEWIDFIKDQELNVGVDSVMVKNWREKLIASGVKPYYLVSSDGNSTCYVDAVKRKMYPSSFSNHPGIDIKVGGFFDFNAEFAKF